MKKTSIALIATTALGIASPVLHAQAPAPAAAAVESPSQAVENAASNILKALDADRDLYRRDVKKREELVSQYLLPHLDTERAARGVLGPHWRTATEEQRKRFVDAFYHSMLSSYGTALVEFTANRMKVLPTAVEPGARLATVRTQIKRDGGDPVSVNYYMDLTPQGWKAYDVQVDGISYVKSFHDDFGAQIDAQGLDSVIARLEKGEKPAGLKNP